MKVLFRVDSSVAIGMGHLSRCMTLAEELRRRGCSPAFVGRRHVGNLMLQLTARGMQSIELPLRAESAAPGGYAGWLGATQDQDRRETLAAAGQPPPAWIVIDHYAIDAGWESAARQAGSQILAIDDLADRRHQCDLLLDQNFTLRDGRYRDLTDPGCRLLLGPRFALLSQNYAAQRRLPTAREVQRVLVFFGGSDPHNCTGKVLAALSGEKLQHLRADIVVGANNIHRQEIVRQAAQRAGTEIHEARPHLADLLARADLAVGAAGTTSYERMCLGVPAVVVITAENQRPGAEALAQAGMIEYLGHADDVAVGGFELALRRAVGGETDLSAQALRGYLTVDGLGALRVAECMLPTEAGKLALREATQGDAALLFSWSNDRDVRRQSVHSGEISWPEHQQWLAAKLADRNCRMLLLEAQGLPVGQIRFEADGGGSRISFSMDAAFRGRGWGKHLVAMGMKRISSESGNGVFIAQVKRSNPASAAVFEGLGFRQSSTPDDQLLRFEINLAHGNMSEAG